MRGRGGIKGEWNGGRARTVSNEWKQKDNWSPFILYPHLKDLVATGDMEAVARTLRGV